MSPRLPVVSGKDAIKIFIKSGYKQTRQRGSHVRLKHPTDLSKKPLTIPLHRVLKPGLLDALIKDSGLSRDEFMRLL